MKNDFVKICEKYLQGLEINLSFEEIEKMSKMSFKKLVKEKTKEVALKYLIQQKNSQSKISTMNYEKLEIQEYLLDGNKNTKLSKLILKAKGNSLDIKTHKSGNMKIPNVWVVK